MEHRVPDYAAHQAMRTASGRNAHLLHTRLSIIDLDPRAHQPLRVGGKTVIYNGELYNYFEIRRELLSHGYRFQSESDTEVLLAAIDLFGWSALDRFEGMWAFAVYDEAQASLTLSRDRFGEK